MTEADLEDQRRLPKSLFKWFENELHSLERDNVDRNRQVILRRIIEPQGSADLQKFFDRLVRLMPVNTAARVVDLLIGKVLVFGPNGYSDVRKEQIEITETLEDIAESAGKLTRAIDRLERIHNAGGLVVADTDFYSILAAIEGAALTGWGDRYLPSLYRDHVKEKIDDLAYQYDGKYWPSVAQVVKHIEQNALSAPIEIDPDASAAMATRQRSLADIVRAILADLDLHQSGPGWPTGLRLRDPEIAAFLRVTMDTDITDGAVRKRRKEFETMKADN